MHTKTGSLTGLILLMYRQPLSANSVPSGVLPKEEKIFFRNTDISTLKNYF